jgi:hypothetical protein
MKMSDEPKQYVDAFDALGALTDVMHAPPAESPVPAFGPQPEGVHIFV